VRSSGRVPGVKADQHPPATAGHRPAGSPLLGIGIGIGIG